jgi:RHS repeat-associated protein
VTAINSYDDYGIPKSTNPAAMGRFGYTGQAWLPEIGLSYYKNRVYSPTLGRFMQSDPIGYGDGVNLYAYVGGDPINFSDPLGLALRRVCEGVEGNVRCGFADDGRGAGGLLNGGGGRGNSVVPNQRQITDGSGGTGDVPKSPEMPKPSTLEKLGQCTADQLGLSTLLGTELSKAGIPETGTKRFITEGSSRGTSQLSKQLAERFPQRIGDTAFGRLTGIKSIPTPRLGQIGRATPVIGRAAGRLIPFVGAALLAYDAISIAICTADN